MKNQPIKTCKKCSGTTDPKTGKVRHLRRGCRLPNKGPSFPESKRMTVRSNIRVDRLFESRMRALAVYLGVGPREALEGAATVGDVILRRTKSIHAALLAVQEAHADMTPAAAKLFEKAKLATAGPPLIMSDCDEAFDMGLMAAAKLFAGVLERCGISPDDVVGGGP